MSNEWHYSKNGKRFGPVSGQQLKELAAKGEVGLDDLVWTEGMPEWVRAAKVPDLVAGEPSIPDSTASKNQKQDSQLLALASPFLSSEKRESIKEFLRVWKTLSFPKQLGIILLAVVIAAAGVWWNLRSSNESSGSSILQRLLSTGVLGTVVTAAFSVLTKFMAYSDDSTPTIPYPNVFLGLSSPRMVSLLVALYVPTMLASLVSRMLVGPELYEYLTGPILIALSMAILRFSLSKQSFDRLLGSGTPVSKLVSLESNERTAVLLAFFTVSAYGLSFVFDRWVLLLYALIVTLPSLHLFFLNRQGVAPIRFIWPLRIGIVILGLVICLGVWVLPRPYTTSLEGTWVSADKEKQKLIISKGGAATLYYSSGSVNHHATMTQRGNQLTLRDASHTWLFTLDTVSDHEIALVANDSDSHYSGFEGRWRKQVASETTETPPPIDPKSTSPPPSAKDESAKIAGSWERLHDIFIERLSFTTSGTATIESRLKGTDDSENRNKGVGNFTFDGKTLRVTTQLGTKDTVNEYKADVVGDDLLLGGSSIGAGFRGLEGRWKRIK